MLSLSATLFESEFFGHTRGAFTGANTSKSGYLDRAQGGTLFLDEIGDLPLELQGKLLRILQEGEFTPVGETRARPSDVRFIAATHRDLDVQLKDGNFRPDLFYRLRFAHLALPPLRRRRDDIVLLATHFVRGSAQPQAQLSSEAQAHLIAHDWPGNVRELAGVVSAAANLAEDGTIAPGHLNLPMRATALNGETIVPLAEIERQHILRAHEATGGNKTRTAALLGISVPTLTRKLKAYRK